MKASCPSDESSVAAAGSRRSTTDVRLAGLAGTIKGRGRTLPVPGEVDAGAGQGNHSALEHRFDHGVEVRLKRVADQRFLHL